MEGETQGEMVTMTSTQQYGGWCQMVHTRWGHQRNRGKKADALAVRNRGCDIQLQTRTLQEGQGYSIVREGREHSDRMLAARAHGTRGALGPRKGCTQYRNILLRLLRARLV